MRSRERSPLTRKLIVECEKLRHPNSGFATFLTSLVPELVAARPAGVDVELRTRFKGMWPDSSLLALERQLLLKERVLERVRPALAPFLWRRRDVVWHATTQMARYFPVDPRVPVVLTVHDLSFLHFEPPGKIPAHLDRLRRKVRRAQAIVTDSEYVARELAEHVDLEERTVTVIPCGAPDVNTTPASRPSAVEAGPFFFSLGRMDVVKNHHVLVELLPRFSSHRLVIGDGGRREDDYAKQIFDRARELGVENRLTLCGLISDGERRWLYENCDLYLFPSLTEGFGLPVLEAYLSGTPVVMSGTTSLPEVGGELGFYWDHYDPAHMAAVVDRALAALADDPELPDRLRTHAQGFSWRRAAHAYWSVYAGLFDSEAGG